jgi:thiol-disulfide isomerase/thioredoxin
MFAFMFLFAATPSTHCVAPDKPQTLSWASSELGAAADRPIWMNLWGSFCKPCLEEMPRVKAFAAKLGVTLVFVGLGNAEKNAEYVKKFGLSDAPNHVFSFGNKDAKGNDRLAGLIDMSSFSFPQQLFFDRAHRLRCKITGAVQDVDLDELKTIAH